MGSPKKQRKKYSKPPHPWQKERILAEKELLKSYGIRRKMEIWKMNSILKNFTGQAKNLITTATKQSDKERSQLLTKLISLGLIETNSKIEDVLTLNLKNIMERRLQTLVFRKTMARSLKQARQFIVHEHISIGDKKITSPSYLVPLSEENNIQFVQFSSFVDSNHPERFIEEKKISKPKKSDKEDTSTESKEKKKESKTDQQKSEPKKTDVKEKSKEKKETKDTKKKEPDNKKKEDKN